MTKRLRPHQVVVMLSPEEYDHLKEEAGFLGVPRAAYLRMILRSDMRKLGKEPTK